MQGDSLLWRNLLQNIFFKMTLLTSDVNGLLFSHLTKNKNLRI